MFGKRGGSGGGFGGGNAAPPHQAAPPVAAPVAAPAAPAPSAPAVPAQMAQPAPPMQTPAAPPIAEKTEDYYDTKSSVFSALIDTIDLGQLAQMEPEAAREEIRDIVNDIISIKNLAMSISEQEDLLEDICNDVLGYGPLEPLLQDSSISDIMFIFSDTIC